MLEDTGWKAHPFHQRFLRVLRVGDSHHQRDELVIRQDILEVQIHLDHKAVAWLGGIVFTGSIKLKYSSSIDISNGIAKLGVQLAVLHLLGCVW